MDADRWMGWQALGLSAAADWLAQRAEGEPVELVWVAQALVEQVWVARAWVVRVLVGEALAG